MNESQIIRCFARVSEPHSVRMNRIIPLIEFRRPQQTTERRQQRQNQFDYNVKLFSVENIGVSISETQYTTTDKQTALARASSSIPIKLGTLNFKNFFILILYFIIRYFVSILFSLVASALFVYCFKLWLSSSSSSTSSTASEQIPMYKCKRIR